MSGFVTEEIRESGRRLGFAVERLGGERGVLAHVELPGPPRVGRYGVDPAALERLAIPALEEVGERGVVIVDELGKMGLSSHPMTDVLERRRGIELLRVTTANRNELADLLAARLRTAR